MKSKNNRTLKIVRRVKYWGYLGFKIIVKKLFYTLALFCNSTSRMTENEARYLLENYSSNSNGSCITNNNYEPSYDLQIILPVYNQEKYLSGCLDSICKQNTTYSYILTIVNDGSTDTSLNIIQHFIEEHKDDLNVELINQPNKGFSGARNAGLKYLKAHYVTFVDSDDYLEDDFVDRLLTNKADIVQAGWYEEYGYGLRKKRYELSGYPWGKIYKSKIFKNFQFPEGYYFEDIPISIIIENMNLKIIELEKDYLYHYRIHSSNFSSNYKSKNKAIDTFYVTELSIKEAKLLDINFTQRSFENIIVHFIENHRRTMYCPVKIREAIFVLEYELLQSYFGNYHSKKYEKLLSAMRKKQFKKFDLLALSY